MKSWIIALTIVAAPFFAEAGCGMDHADKSAKHQDGHKATIGQAKDGKIDVKITGMSCAGCVKTLKEKIAKFVTTDDVVINVEVNNVTVDYSKAKLKGNDLTKLKTQIEKAVAESKFNVVKDS